MTFVDYQLPVKFVGDVPGKFSVLRRIRIKPTHARMVLCDDIVAFWRPYRSLTETRNLRFRSLFQPTPLPATI